MAWNGIKDVFKGVFESLYAIVKGPLNMIIEWINAVISGLNNMSFEVPDWSPVGAGITLGINIPKIPKLASGGITGVNNPFLAMVGDNKTQREAIAPVDDLMAMIQTAVSATN